MELTPEQKAAVDAEIQRVAGKIRDEAEAKGARDRQAAIDAYLAEQAEIQRLAALEGEELLKAQAATAETARQAAEATAAQTRAQLANTLALTTAEAPVNPAHLSDALTLLDVPADADDATRAAAVKALSERVPTFFTTTGQAPLPPGARPPVPPPPPPPPGGSGKSAAERAKERFQTTQTPLAPTG